MAPKKAAALPTKPKAAPKPKATRVEKAPKAAATPTKAKPALAVPAPSDVKAKSKTSETVVDLLHRTSAGAPAGWCIGGNFDTCGACVLWLLVQIVNCRRVCVCVRV